MRYVFHPEALTEYAEAVQYYTERRVEVAQAFINNTALHRTAGERSPAESSRHRSQAINTSMSRHTCEQLEVLLKHD